MHLWDAQSGKLLRLLPAGRGPAGNGGAWAVEFSPDGTLLASASGWYQSTAPGQLKVWEVVSGNERLDLRSHAGPLFALAFSPDGTRLAAGGGLWEGRPSRDKKPRGEVILWDVSHGNEVLTLPTDGPAVCSTAFSADGLRLAAGDREGVLTVWDVRELDQIEGEVAKPDSERLVAILGGNRLASSLAAARSLPSVGDLAAPALTASSDSDSPLRRRSQRLLERLNPSSSTELKQYYGHEAAVTNSLFSPDGSRLLSADTNGLIRLWDSATCRELTKLVGHSGAVTSVTFSLDGKRVYSSGDDRTVRQWDLATGGQLWTTPPLPALTRKIIISPDGRHLAGGGYDHVVRVWNATTGEAEQSFPADGDKVVAVAFSPDSGHLASCGHDRFIRLWDFQNRKLVRRFEGHTALVHDICFSPDGRYLLSGGWDRTARLWDVESGRELRRFAGHQRDAVHRVGFFPDGQRVFSACPDGTVRFWRLSQEHEFFRIDGDVSDWCCATLSPDARHIVFPVGDHSLRMWRLPRLEPDAASKPEPSAR